MSGSLYVLLHEFMFFSGLILGMHLGSGLWGGLVWGLGVLLAKLLLEECYLMH